MTLAAWRHLPLEAVNTIILRQRHQRSEQAYLREQVHNAETPTFVLNGILIPMQGPMAFAVNAAHRTTVRKRRASRKRANS